MLVCRIILVVYKEIYKNNTKIISEIMLYLNVYRAHTLQLQKEQFYFLIKPLNTFKFSGILYVKANYYKCFDLNFPSFQFLRLPASFLEYLNSACFALLQACNIILVQRFPLFPEIFMNLSNCEA